MSCSSSSVLFLAHAIRFARGPSGTTKEVPFAAGEVDGPATADHEELDEYCEWGSFDDQETPWNDCSTGFKGKLCTENEPCGLTISLTLSCLVCFVW
jgi:hypothetical protein